MRKHFFETKALLTLLLAFSISASIGQVVVNEICFANYTDWGLGGGWGGGDFEDWVEFYNPTGADVSLEGYYLTDTPTDLMKFELPAEAVVPGNGYLVVLFTGLYEADPFWEGYINSSFKVTQTAGESFIFSDPGGAELEGWTFGVDISTNTMNNSWGRSSDGAADWVIHLNPSPEGANGGAQGTAYAATPQITPQAGYYAGGTNVTITTTEPSSTIYYTTDGSEPYDTDMVYSGPISVDATTVIRAITYSSNGDILPSVWETNTYFVGDDEHTIPTWAVCGGEVDGNWEGDHLMHVEMFDENGVFVVEAFGDSNEHGNDSNAYDQRGWDYITRDALGRDNEVQYPVFHRRDRDSYERLIFKAAANDNYPYSNGCHVRDAYCHDLSIVADMKLDQRATEFCIAYLNGEYWGVYDVREKVDDIDYTNEYYDQPQNFVDFIKTWGGTWEEYGDGLNEWNDLVDFITGNDMTDAANYDYVTSQYNQTSLIDYFVLNSFVVCADWLNWNTAWWKGNHPDGSAKRWRYALWDQDNTFGHGANYSGLPDTGASADPCNPEDLGDLGGQGHVPVFNALQDNDDFMAEYVNRFASMSNSYFSCDYMHYHLDSMIALIAPEMQRQIDRWYGNYNDWEDNVQDMHDFIEERCSDEFVTGMEDCYDIVAVTLTIIVDGLGLVEIQGLAPITQGTSPWDGIYYAEIPIELEALIDAGVFLGWEVLDGDVVIADPTNPLLTISLLGDATIIAHFNTDLEPALIQFDVEPAGAGDILIDNVPMGPYPNTVLIDGGIRLIEATENPWFEFDHWETVNANINPDDDEPEGSFLVITTDTIVAVYNEIPHFNLTVDVSPAGAGTITMDGNPLASYPWSDVVAGEVDINFMTIPADMWSIFSHWEINNNVITPDELSLNMMVNLTSDDEIVAVYNVIPHFGITIVVDPPYSGTVVVENLVTVADDWSGIVAGSTDIGFLATPSPFWNFAGWKANWHAPSPDSESREVAFNFSAYDTVFAFFEPEQFSMYIPNSFTPNNDGRNDVFLPVGNALDVSDYSLTIFDRWGFKVFETTDPNKPWTGDNSGGAYYVKDEVYVYHLTVKSVHDLEEKEFMGHIMVFR